MEILLAKTAGFCFGVDRAVKLTYRLVEEGLTDAIMQAPQQEYTRRLIAAIPTRNRPMARREDGCD